MMLVSVILDALTSVLESMEKTSASVAMDMNCLLH